MGLIHYGGQDGVIGGELYRAVGVQFVVNAHTPSAQLNADGLT